MWGELNMHEETAGLALRRKKDSIWPGGFSDEDNLGLRVHRAISWIERAEQESDDADAAFVFYWIAFNSAYAKDMRDAPDIGERTRFGEYFQVLVDLDAYRRIYDAVWSTFAGPIRVLLDNQYVFQPFWNHVNGLPGYDGWGKQLRDEQTRRSSRPGCLGYRNCAVDSLRQAVRSAQSGHPWRSHLEQLRES